MVVALAAVSYGATPGWLDLVAPIITSAEKKAYRDLAPAERPKFEEAFWADKAITAQEYINRVEYIDTKFGSTKVGSGANTDQGRVYLSLGPPNKITRIPSSRVFQPVEIWYYSTVPGVINTEVSLMFFQKNGTGFFKLYSPTQDTIRALLISQASTVHMFSPNDDLKEADIRTTLKVSPAEDEVVSASVNVAKSIRYEGNDDLLGKVSSPGYMLGIPLREEVKSRFIVGRPKLDILETPSVYGGSQVDLGIDVTAQHKVDIEVFQGDLIVYQNHLNLKFSESTSLRYTHRLDLLPGAYRVLFIVDGADYPYNLTVPEHAAMGAILRADETDVTAEHRQTPFNFEGKQLDLNPEGKLLVVAVAQPGTVRWVIRKGGAGVLWKSVSEANQVAVVAPPVLPPGLYKLEAYTENDTRIADLVVNQKNDATAASTLLSFNANLHPALRYAFVAHQWLLRGKLDEARGSLQASLAKVVTDEARIELARVDALAGNLDAARDEVKRVLEIQPNNFEALSVFAYIETKFQDYAVAAELYRRALAVQESPAVRAALARLPVQ